MAGTSPAMTKEEQQFTLSKKAGVSIDEMHAGIHPHHLAGHVAR